MKNIIIVVVIVVAVLAIAGFLLTNKASSIQSTTTTSISYSSTIGTNYQTSSVTTISSGGFNSPVAYAGDGTNVNAGILPACSSSSQYFTRSPVNNSQLYWIEPLGHVGGPHVLPSQGDHIYFYAQLRSNNTPYPIPIYSPGNVTLLQVAVAKSNVSRELSTSYILFFSPCRSLMFGFQLANASPVIQNAIASTTPLNCQGGSQQSFCVYNTSLKLKAGDRVGMIGAASFDYGLDFAAADVRTTPLPYIDLKQGTGFLADSYLHTACPLDYFVNSTKAYLYGRLGQKNTSINGIPVCGATMQDLAGTSQGDWYLRSSTNGPYRGLNISASLAIMHLNVNPSFGVISVGGSSLVPNSNGGAQMDFLAQSSGQINREPDQVTPDGKIYCYQGSFGFGATYVNGTVNLNNGQLSHVDVRLDNATTLEIDYASGQCAATPALTNPTTYVR